MNGFRWIVATCLAAATPLSGAADSAAERKRLAAERASIEARFRGDEAACRERFVVTPCVEEAKASRRLALAKVRDQELVLDDADRKLRAQNRRRDIADKRAHSAAQAASAASAAKPASASPSARQALAAPAPASAEAPASRPALDGAAAASRRADKAAQRQEQARLRQQRIEQREREHQKKGRKAAPLPASAGRP